MIKGITVTLINKKQSGTDGFNRPIFIEEKVLVDNVLVSPTSYSDVTEQLDLTGKKEVYTLAIPKGDNHIWEDQDVEFFGHRYHVFTTEPQGIEKMIPLSWNKKVMVERYD